MKRLLPLASSALLLLPLASPAARPTWRHHAHPSMGTVLEVDYSPRIGGGGRNLERALAEVDGVEAAISRWAPDSELSKFNELPEGVPHTPSTILLHLFSAAEHFRYLSHGAFSCRMEPYLSWKHFAPPAPGRTPSGDALLARCSPLAVILCSGKLFKMHPDAGLDFDGLAKGYALDCAASIFRRGSRAFALSYGSSGIVSGPGAGRALALPDPRSGGPESPILAAVWIESGAWSTSSCAENRQDGLCHILDPRTLEPVATPLLSATVFAPSAETADAMSTAIMVLGVQEGIRLLEEKGLDGVLISAAPIHGALPAGGLFLLATPGLVDRLEVAP